MGRTLGPREAELLNTLAGRGRDSFTTHDAYGVLGQSEAAVRMVLARLLAKQWIRRLDQGKYQIVPLEAGSPPEWAEHELVVAARLVQPYYVAYASALQYHGYTEHPGGDIWIVTTGRKRPVVAEGRTYRFVTLAGRKFFGYTAVSILDAQVQIANREKAVLDGFDHPEYCFGALEAAKGLWLGSEELDFALLTEYARKLGNRAAARRLGYWMERLKLGSSDLWQQLHAGRDRNYARLDPRAPTDGRLDPHWRLVINVPERQLTEWMEH